MRRWFDWICLFALNLSVFVWVGPGVAAPLEAYGRLPSVEDVQISPDGADLAFVVTQGEQRQIVIKRLSDGAVAAGLNVGHAKLRGLQWADPQHLLITTSVAGYATGVLGARGEWFLTQVFDLTRKKIQPLLGDVPGAMNVTFGAPEIRTVNGHVVIFIKGVDFIDHRGVRGLFEADVASGRGKIVEPGSDRTVDWLVDAAGKPIAETRYDQPSGLWTLRIHKDDGHWVDSRALSAPTDEPGLAGLGRDGRSVLVRTLEAGQSRLHEVSTVDANWGPPLADPYRLLLHDQTTHAWIGGQTLHGDTLSYSFFDLQRQANWDSARDAYPGELVRLVSASADRRKLVVLVDGPKDGAAYAVVDLGTGRADWVGDVYADVKPADIGEVRRISYKAADGLALTGYSTLPNGKAPKNLPLVVLPHGGPAARDEPGFDWWAQAIASRGYAVLQPNFRGSRGFGELFLAAGFGQWGRKMQTDLSDGVRSLAAQGIIDPKRVCIFGGSYGGYAALAGATLDPGVYRCAISLAGPSDLRRMLRWEQSRQSDNRNETLRYWDRFMGATGANDVALDAISPADQAAKATIPVLLIHGKDDTVVPFEQSQIMADALKRAGKPATLVTLDGEDHWLSRGDTRLQMLTAAVGFLEANNPPN